MSQVSQVPMIAPLGRNKVEINWKKNWRKNWKILKKDIEKKLKTSGEQVEQNLRNSWRRKN